MVCAKFCILLDQLRLENAAAFGQGNLVREVSVKCYYRPFQCGIYSSYIY